MKRRFAKKRDRKNEEEEEDVNFNIVETQPKKVFLKPKDWGISIGFIKCVCVWGGGVDFCGSLYNEISPS